VREGKREPRIGENRGLTSREEWGSRCIRDVKLRAGSSVRRGSLSARVGRKRRSAKEAKVVQLTVDNLSHGGGKGGRVKLTWIGISFLSRLGRLKSA